MKDAQWEQLLAVLHGEQLRPLPAGFIIDSPWLPNWAGHTILDYFTSDRVWWETNLKALERFPSAWFLPGFWSEYGMCTEPSAFGSVSLWEEDAFPFSAKVITSIQQVDTLATPNPRKHGLLPFAIKRLLHHQTDIERAGHKIRFAVARGPLNIASFLMGTTEFLTELKMDPDRTHRLLGIITDFLVEWIAYQREVFPSIDGILTLDDIVGFISPADFEEFGLPYLQRIYSADVSVKFFHNDAPCKACAPYLAKAGINLLNFGVQHTLSEMQKWTEGKITLLGNLPPRDILANAAAEEVARATRAMLEALETKTRFIVSCGGGMPPAVSSENVEAVLKATAGFPV
jgi:uroporphyrinogen-III decarboxylase